MYKYSSLLSHSINEQRRKNDGHFSVKNFQQKKVKNNFFSENSSEMEQSVRKKNLIGCVKKILRRHLSRFDNKPVAELLTLRQQQRHL